MCAWLLYGLPQSTERNPKREQINNETVILRQEEKVRQARKLLNKYLPSAQSVPPPNSGRCIAGKLALRRLLVPRIEVHIHSSPHQAQVLNHSAPGSTSSRVFPAMSQTVSTRTASKKLGIGMPSSTAVSLASSLEEIAPAVATWRRESDMTLSRNVWGSV